MNDVNKTELGNIEQGNVKHIVTYKIGDSEVKLSPSIINNLLSVGGKDMTDKECFKFINLCKFQKLNPFVFDAYPIKFGDTVQMVVSKYVFLKRANKHPQQDGFDAGIIIERDGIVLEVKGSFMLETDKLIGGWCDVYRKDISRPFSAKVLLSEYTKSQSTWKEKKATMIRKVALVHALREAYPEELGNLYIDSEFASKNIQTPEYKEDIIDGETDTKKLTDFK